MKKSLFTFIATLLIATSCYSQSIIDYCGDIRKFGSELTETSYMMSKAIWLDKKNNVLVMKTNSRSASGLAIIFTNYSKELSHYKKGIYIKFEDSTFYRNPDIKSDVEFDSDNLQFKYTTMIVLNKTNIDNFISKRILSLNYAYSGDMEMVPQEASRLRGYIKCIN